MAAARDFIDHHELDLRDPPAGTLGGRLRQADLAAQLRTIAEHWPGKWSRYCCGCDDEQWPCQVVLDVVVPWMEPEEVPE